ncbi:MAG: DUF222 domain-containing protein [Actinomycetia bacterium]|nr:DUF222 domain-containing protein [Actinomycetes bacterium]
MFDPNENDDRNLDDLPTDELETELIGWAGTLAAATARWLEQVAAYDRRKGWQEWDCRSAAHWLSWKCGMSLRTGRDHVRVARALEELPLIAAAFRDGELSFSKVRAITRIATPLDQEALLDLARAATAAHLDRIVGGCVSALRRQAEDQADHGWTRRKFSTHNHGDGTVEITIRVTTDDAERLTKAVGRHADVLLADSAGDLEDLERAERIQHLGGWSAIKSDAAVELLCGLVDRNQADPVELAVEVDVEALAEPGSRDERDLDGSPLHCSAGGAWLSREVARRSACDGSLRAVLRDEQGHALGVGRKTKVVPRWLRRRLERRDHHHCQFPDCSTTNRLHAHHIIHWTNHGPTDLDNLILLCPFHHRLVHEGRWSVRGKGGESEFVGPDGRAATSDQLKGSVAQIAEAAPQDLEALIAWWGGERLDLHYAVGVILDAQEWRRRKAAEGGSAEPPLAA